MAQMVKNFCCNARDPGSISELERYPGEGNGNPLPYSHEQRSLADYSLWGHQELDMTEQLTHILELPQWLSG